MKAAQIAQYGDASAITINQIERPAAGPDDIVVEVRAASLNPFDTMFRQGYLADKVPVTLPVTLGGDIAGVVFEAGQNVQGFKAGDPVFGQATAAAGASGAFAEYARTAAGKVAKAPGNLDFTQAASLVLVGVSALQALTRHIDLKSGEILFIHGGAGGIGSAAIQIARHIGARVIATSSGDNAAYVKELGADEVIDYRSRDFTQAVRGADAVLDLVGGDDFNRSLGVLRRGGIAVSTIGQADEALAGKLGVRALTQFTDVNSDALDALRALIEEGVVTPHVGKVYPIEEVREAFLARESRLKGKVVLQI